MKFEAIFFDLYNTLLYFDFSRLPEVEFRGQTLPTTSVEVHRRVQEVLNIAVPYQRFLEEFLESLEIITEKREQEYREFSCLERFQIMCSRLKITDNQAAELMVQVHMDEMFRTMYCPDKTTALLDRLSDIPLVLVSNFDHAPTVRRALSKFGLEERFEGIFISEEVGWRKPGEKFFEIVLEKTKRTPEQCLYVGDDPQDDLYGANREGFQVAWLLESSQPQDPPVVPRWVIRNLSEVLKLASHSPE
ncbi:HAD family hydrolase [Acidobacteria bacterium AH-259-D05]|nr:HAD family hydrolase [Acidobacteria bacterium AH-259-D05]